MREGWVIKTLRDICDLQNGFAFKSKSYVDHSNTLNIRMSNIRPNGNFDPEHNIKYLPNSFADVYDQFLLKEGDLIIAMTDMAGDPKILGLPTLVKNVNGRRFLLNQRVGKLKDFTDNIFIPYLRYFLSSPKTKNYYKSKGAGGLQINISKVEILRAEIPLPPLPEQKRIVAILDEAFEAISRSIANTEKNLVNARELFNSYLNNVFTQKGDGWVEKKLSEVIMLSETIDPRKKPDTIFFYVDVSSISNQSFKITEASTILGKDAPSRARRLIKSGDILFATVRPTLRRIAIVPDEMNGEVCSTGYFVFRPKPELDNKFLFYHLFTDKFMVAMESLQSGASYPAVNNMQVKQQNISFPHLPKQKRIVAILDELSAETHRLETIYKRKLSALTELKQSLLQKAFSGELTANDTTIKKEAVA